MPKNKIHCAISIKRTGKSYENLHKWIDDNKDDTTVNHRSEKHFYTDELRKHISENFGGPEAVSEWLFHIALDNLDTSVTNDWNWAENDGNFFKLGFEEDGFIHYEEDEIEQLDEEFEDGYKKD